MKGYKRAHLPLSWVSGLLIHLRVRFSPENENEIVKVW